MIGAETRLEALRLAVGFAASAQEGFDHDDVVDAAEAFAAFLAGDSKEAVGEWIKWRGGECPVAAGAMVEVLLSGGSPREPSKAGSFRWGYLGGDYDITHYRVVEPGA